MPVVQSLVVPFVAIPPAVEHPEAHARDAVEAMQAAGTYRPDVEAAILAAGRGHAELLERQGMSPEDWR